MTLEISTFSVGDMALSHLHLTTAGGTISERFSAAMKLLDLGPLSNALRGHQSWDSPQVRKARDLLLGNRTRAKAHYETWCRLAAEAFVEIFYQVEATKREIYGSDSFFPWLDSHPNEKHFPEVDADPPPARDDGLFFKYCK